MMLRNDGFRRAVSMPPRYVRWIPNSSASRSCDQPCWLRSSRIRTAKRRTIYTFNGSDNGGHTAAVLTSLIATCKRHHIDPFAYLRDVFQRISGHPHKQLANLLPDHWLVARTAAAS